MSAHKYARPLATARACSDSKRESQCIAMKAPYIAVVAVLLFTTLQQAQCCWSHQPPTRHLAVCCRPQHGLELVILHRHFVRSPHEIYQASPDCCVTCVLADARIDAPGRHQPPRALQGCCYTGGQLSSPLSTELGVIRYLDMRLMQGPTDASYDLFSARCICQW